METKLKIFKKLKKTLYKTKGPVFSTKIEWPDTVICILCELYYTLMNNKMKLRVKNELIYNQPTIDVTIRTQYYTQNKFNESIELMQVKYMNDTFVFKKTVYDFTENSVDIKDPKCTDLIRKWVDSALERAISHHTFIAQNINYSLTNIKRDLFV